MLFCTAFAKTKEEWNERYQRWLRAIRESTLVYDNIMIVDDGSPVLPDWTDVEIHTDEVDENSAIRTYALSFPGAFGTKGCV